MDNAEIRGILIAARREADEAYSDEMNRIRVYYPSFQHLLEPLREERKTVYREFTKRINALPAETKTE